MNKAYDSYEQFFTEESELIADVLDTAQNSEWISKIPSCAITVTGMDGPLIAETMRESQFPYLDAEIVQETAECGSGLLMSYGGEYLPVRQSAIPTLQSTLRIGGLALGKMSPVLAGECYNNAATVAEGNTLCLVRYGKISACHSDAVGGYAIMPIPELLDITKDICGKKFGKMRFISGYNSHESTYAEWELPDAQGELLDLYRDAVSSTQNGSSHYVFNFMPALKFISSDTASFCATLKPVFIDPLNGREICLVAGVQVKHTKRGKQQDALELYRTEAESIYAKFCDFAKVAADLQSIQILHPCNVVVSMCKNFCISKKYGAAAYEEAEIFELQGDYVSAHDIILAMSACVLRAKTLGASTSVQTNLEEAIAKMARYTNKSNWAGADVPGKVAWKN